MSDYQRVRVPGGSYFFTVVTADRRPVFSSEASIDMLRESLRAEMKRRHYYIDAIVIMPDHLHCLWQLPAGDADYSQRWRQIKRNVSRRFGGRVWQPSFWEHVIRDRADWKNHVDYIHYNPVRHGYVKRAIDWRWSSFHQWHKRGAYAASWGESMPSNVSGLDFE